MKRTGLAIIAFAVTLLLIPGCKDSKPTTGSTDSLATKYAKFPISIYKDTTFSREAWKASLEKGEPVELLSEETIINAQKKEMKVSKVKLSDGEVGYIASDYLAVKPVVFVDENVKVYNRNNINSGEFAVIPAGTLGFVTDEKADWVQVDVGSVNGKNVYKKWVKGGISDSSEVVADAVSLEKIRNILSEKSKGDKEEALTLLRTLADKSNAIGSIAKSDLSKTEGTGNPAEGADNSANQNEGE
ncbi:MAG TPA: hypothetical protein PKK43_03180 [Spirochaetota bacterium]|nr:hypothetical protein [Spirochaetota bacterium]